MGNAVCGGDPVPGGDAKGAGDAQTADANAPLVGADVGAVGNLGGDKLRKDSNHMESYELKPRFKEISDIPFWDRVFCIMIPLWQGFHNLPKVLLYYYLLLATEMDVGQLSILGGFGSFAWSVKPLFAFAAAKITIRGCKRKYHYMGMSILYAVNQLLMLVIMAIPPNSTWALFAVVILYDNILSACLVTCDVLGDGLHTMHSNRSELIVAQRFRSMVWMTIIGGWIAAFFTTVAIFVIYNPTDESNFVEFLMINFALGLIISPIPVIGAILYKENDEAHNTEWCKTVLEADIGVKGGIPACLLCKMFWQNVKHKECIIYVACNLAPGFAPSAGTAFFFWLIFVRRLNIFLMLVCGNVPWVLTFYPAAFFYNFYYVGKFTNQQLVGFTVITNSLAGTTSVVLLLTRTGNAYLIFALTDCWYGMTTSNVSRVGYLLSSARHVAGMGVAETMQSFLYSSSNGVYPIRSVVSAIFYAVWGMKPRQGLYPNLILFVLICQAAQIITQIPYIFFAAISDAKSMTIRNEVEASIFELQVADGFVNPDGTLVDPGVTPAAV